MQKTIATLFIGVMSVCVALPVQAAAPADGLVLEGHSVPGLALGDSRAQVEGAYGPPDSCQSANQGDFASCSFPVEGGGTVTVSYRGPDGGSASNSPDDVVYNIRWYEQVSGWVTTAGVNTSLAASDPDAVIAAYPDAAVSHNQFGGVYRVVDHEQGVEVLWALDFYSGRTHVSMAIFFPRDAPPPVEKLTRITDIELTAVKVRGRQVRALVRVQNEADGAAAGASVLATWEYPDGSTLPVIAVTSRSGYAYFEILRAARGTYTLRIDDVVLSAHRFDLDNSVLEASVAVR